MADIADTLAQRGNAYGDFREHARIAQNIKKAMQDSPNWESLPDYMKEGLEMLAHKAARLLNGDPLYDDNLHDIVGYTKLMQDRAAQDREAKAPETKTKRPALAVPATVTPPPTPATRPFREVSRKHTDARYTTEFDQLGSVERVRDIVNHCVRTNAVEAKIALGDLKNLINVADDLQFAIDNNRA